MEMPYPANNDYIQYVFELLEEFDTTQTNSPIPPGHPKTDSNRTLNCVLLLVYCGFSQQCLLTPYGDWSCAISPI